VTPAQAGCGGGFKTRTNILVGCGKNLFHLISIVRSYRKLYDICTIRRRFIAAGFPNVAAVSAADPTFYSGFIKPCSR
jgi:hypothetical protein